MLHPLLKKNQKQTKQHNRPHTTPQQLFFIRYLHSCCRDPFISLYRALPSHFSAFFPAPKSPAPGNPCKFSLGLMTRDKGRRARLLRSKRQHWHQKQKRPRCCPARTWPITPAPAPMLSATHSSWVLQDRPVQAAAGAITEVRYLTLTADNDYPPTGQQVHEAPCPWGGLK